MVAFFDDPPLIHDDNPVSGANGREPVRNDNCGATDHQALESILNQFFAFGVQCACRLIKQQNRRVSQQCAGNRKPLPLAAGKPRAALAQICLQTFGKLTQETCCIGLFSRCPNRVVARIPLAVAQIVAR